ncbi:MAG: B12-binding domain-containing radical SAM protein [Myxococcota bacterium]
MHVVFASVGAGELLGVESLSAVLRRAGHRTSLVHDAALFDDRFDLSVRPLARLFDERPRAIRDILASKPDLIAFSCITSTFRWAVEVAAAVRTVRRIPTVFGGAHASALPAWVVSRPEVDYVCEGEGEDAIVALADALAGGGDVRVPGIWTKAGPPHAPARLADLGSLPFADKELYAAVLPKRPLWQTMTGRGCPFVCTYCYNSQRGATAVRRRPVEHVLDELRWGKRRFDFSAVEFHDDIFTFDAGWLADFLPRYRAEIGRPYCCQVHPRFLDADRARLLADTGCFRVKMGVQSLADRTWKARNLKRAETEEDVARAIDTCRRIGLRIEVDHILGFPGEPPEAQEHALRFYGEHTPARIGTYWLSYFPGTEITKRALATGVIDAAREQAMRRGDVVSYHSARAQPDPRERARLEGYAAALQVLPLLPSSVRRRIRAEWLARVPNASALARWVQAAELASGTTRGRGYDAAGYTRFYAHHVGRRAKTRL